MDAPSRSSVALWIGCLLVWIASGPAARGAPKAPTAGTLYFLTITVGTHDEENGTPDDWNYTAVELEKIVRAHCGPLFHEVKSHLIKGSQATPAGILKGFEWLQANVKDGDLAFIYSGSHGGSDDSRGFCLYANGGILFGDQIKPALAKIKGRVVYAIQACQAGDLLEKHSEDLEAMPRNVAAVCAARRGQTSHGIMLPPVMEALEGWADANADGLVSIGEFLHYVDHRISDFYPGKWAETQHAAVARPKGFDLTTPLAKVLPNVRLGRDAVMVELRNNWYGGIVYPRKDPTRKGRVWVHLYGDKPNEDGWTEPDRICPPDAEPASIRKGDKWFTAVLLKPVGDKYLVRFVDNLGEKEATVAKGRIWAYSLDDPNRRQRRNKN